MVKQFFEQLAKKRRLKALMKLTQLKNPTEKTNFKFTSGKPAGVGHVEVISVKWGLVGSGVDKAAAVVDRGADGSDRTARNLHGWRVHTNIALKNTNTK